MFNNACLRHLVVIYKLFWLNRAVFSFMGSPVYNPQDATFRVASHILLYDWSRVHSILLIHSPSKSVIQNRDLVYYSNSWVGVYSN